MAVAEQLRTKVVSRAVRNVRRGNADEESNRGMYRPEIRLDLQRSRFFSESFRETDREAMVLRRAKALANLLNKMGIFIRDHERIVGCQTSDINGIYHPIDQNWKSPKRLVHSEAGKTLLDNAGKRELDDLCDYWSGKSMSDRFQATIPESLRKYWTYEGTFLWSQLSELGIPDYERLFDIGLKGRIQEARARLAEMERTIPVDYVDQKEFLEAAIISLEAVVNFGKRYAKLALEMAAEEKDPMRKAQLEETSRVCEWVPENPPRNLLEAIQFFYFIHLVRYLEYSTLGIGIRIDKLFGPYYEKDLAEGLLSREGAIDTPATPDGRKNSGFFSDSTLAPASGVDTKGPTAVLKSVSKIKTIETYNHLLNQKFLPKFLEDDMKPAFISYLKAWKELDISHIQFNIVDKETLVSAQDYPEEYADLIVRVAGFSAYFVDLSKGLQDHIIARTEQNLA